MDHGGERRGNDRDWPYITVLPCNGEQLQCAMATTVGSQEAGFGFLTGSTKFNENFRFQFGTGSIFRFGF